MTKKNEKKAPAKPKTDEKKKSGKVRELDELELTKIVGGGFYDPANNCQLH